MMVRQANRSIRAACRLALRRVDLRVIGLEHVPPSGPAVIAARHYHHLYDGCALLTVIPRPVHIVVALDWLRHPIGLRAMTTACGFAGWPIVSRPDYPRPDAWEGSGRTTPGSSLLVAARECVAILRAGGLLLVFPEGYPTIDPTFTPKRDDDAFLPFHAGFARFALLAERDGQTRVPIVPAGLEYRWDGHWQVTLRFGPAQWPTPDDDPTRLVSAVAEQVRILSGLPSSATAPAGKG
jgi:putative membrane protein